MKKFQLKGFFVHLTLISVSLLCIFPFLWLLSTPMLEKLDRIQRKYGCFYTKKVSE